MSEQEMIQLTLPTEKLQAHVAYIIFSFEVPPARNSETQGQFVNHDSSEGSLIKVKEQESSRSLRKRDVKDQGKFKCMISKDEVKK